MKKLLLINVSANSGSTGRIAHQIGLLSELYGYDSTLAYGRVNNNSTIKTIRIGNDWNVKIYGIESRLFDNHGFSSRFVTKKFVKEIKEIKPDIINIHNLHGYYIHVGILFDYLKTLNVPVVWTLHDCWAFTGHCGGFDKVNCEKWKSECYDCPLKKSYPTSYILNRARSNFRKKKSLFTILNAMTIVTPSKWLKDIVSMSFLNKYELMVIHNGVDLDVFRPNMNKPELLIDYNLTNKKIILGVADIWSKRKGLDDFVKLANMVSPDYQIILVGIKDKDLDRLPTSIIGIKRTENVQQLADLYAFADVFVNPTAWDNFPTTNIEALACGTPVITYRTGGSPEAIDENTGIVVEKGDVDALKNAIVKVCNKDREAYRVICRTRAECLFNKNDRFLDYIKLFDSLVNK